MRLALSYTSLVSTHVSRLPLSSSSSTLHSHFPTPSPSLGCIFQHFSTDSSAPFYGSPRPLAPPPLYDTHKQLPYQYKLVLFLKSTLEAASDPTNADAVATTLDISSHLTLTHIHAEMTKTHEGLKILSVKPTASTHMPDSTFSSLSSLPLNSFGRRYFEFMSSHGFDPHHRPTVKVRYHVCLGSSLTFPPSHFASRACSMLTTPTSRIFSSAIGSPTISTTQYTIFPPQF